MEEANNTRAHTEVRPYNNALQESVNGKSDRSTSNQ